jgi:DNA-binding NtrC family response regulator
MAVGTVFTAERPISATVLIVDDEDATRSLCHDVVTDSGLRTRTASTTEQALEILDQMPVDILITDLRVPQIGGPELLKRARSNYPQTAVLVLTQYGTIESAVEATRLGAADYITKPFHIPELRSKLDRMIRLLDVDQENRVLRETLRTRPGFADLIGVSLKMQRVYRLIERVSQHAYPVLILGESGTGKELVARSVHFSGVRRNKPFIPVDCSSLVPTWIEAELFGYVKGVFTGALHAKQGLMEIADGGTLFLDEIGDLPFDMQAKLLRALQEKEVRPVGSTDRIPLSARIIAATNHDLDAAVRLGTFRQDLFFRLNVVQIKIPPLRERKTDIPILVNSFLEKFSEANGRMRTISEDAIARMMACDWPGNVRELENAIERAIALGPGPSCTPAICRRVYTTAPVTACPRITSCCHSMNSSGARCCEHCAKRGATSWPPRACWESARPRCTASSSSPRRKPSRIDCRTGGARDSWLPALRPDRLGSAKNP